jgi:hypothetical protein
MASEPNPAVGDDFEEAALAPPNGATTAADATAARPKPKPLFGGVSAKIAARAKKGTLSTSRTGKAKQASYALDKPKKSVYVMTHPSPDYSMVNVPTFVNEATGTWHYISPDLFGSGELPDRFVRAIKLIDIYAAGGADGTFFLWFINVTSHSSRKGAIKAVETARSRYIIVEWLKSAATYTIEPATEAIPLPKWESLPTLETMMLDAFESVVSVADDKVVTDYMSGGVASNRDKEDEEA